ncbi:MAG: acyl-CoA reductase [Chitinophagaceae bacterium]|nr:acyl-CoA reductase [Chitinophagaceae bacterium]
MNLHTRIEILVSLGNYLTQETDTYQDTQFRAWAENKWFIPDYINLSGKAIAAKMLQKQTLLDIANQYQIPDQQSYPKTIGLVMAGNIPYVGLQDLICIFLSGHKVKIKPSSKDTVLLKQLLEHLIHQHPETAEWISIQEMLKDCEAYIATGSDNSARYFEYYFSKYPHIIRKNRTSIALLDGTESHEELDQLADDIQLYFGLGCRNVTQIWVPQDYDFVPLLSALKKYDDYKNHDKYKNNFDYQLTIAIMNNRFYMSNDSIVLLENESPFSPISQLHYQHYDQKEKVIQQLDREKIQCIVGKGFIPFGKAQSPDLTDFPDGVDTLAFLINLT